jgi:hypothetical protein
MSELMSVEQRLFNLRESLKPFLSEPNAGRIQLLCNACRNPNGRFLQMTFAFLITLPM